jgi:hypothetical protein
MPQWLPEFGYWTASVNNRRVFEQDGGKEADARATMLIYLLENNLIDAQGIRADY